MVAALLGAPVRGQSEHHGRACSRDGEGQRQRNAAPAAQPPRRCAVPRVVARDAPSGAAGLEQSGRYEQYADADVPLIRPRTSSNVISSASESASSSRPVHAVSRALPAGPPVPGSTASTRCPRPRATARTSVDITRRDMNATIRRFVAPRPRPGPMVRLSSRTGGEQSTRGRSAWRSSQPRHGWTPRAWRRRAPCGCSRSWD